jgi:hypothetical protein
MNLSLPDPTPPAALTLDVHVGCADAFVRWDIDAVCDECVDDMTLNDDVPDYRNGGRE